MLKTTIPLVDLRGKTPVDLLRAYPDKARDLVAAARRSAGIWSQMASAVLLPFADKCSHNWLKHTHNPYLYEIETFADILQMNGVYALNLCYEWACTSGAYRNEDNVQLLRVLDWPFPALGKHVMVVRQQGTGGDFYNITWPGMSGVFTGLKPGCFACALNSAPMRKHRLTFAGDWLKNRVRAGQETGLPPSHLLRQVFEQARDYEEAKAMLSQTRLAVPALFTLTGADTAEGCVIERLESGGEIMELGAGQQVSVSNHFNSGLDKQGHGWWPRPIDSHGRYRQSCNVQGYELEQQDFTWLQAPMVNRLTRLAVLADAASNRLMVQGFEGATAVTELFNLPVITGALRAAG